MDLINLQLKLLRKKELKKVKTAQILFQKFWIFLDFLQKMMKKLNMKKS